MKNYVVKNNVTINAPTRDVWNALTDPEKTKKYFFHCKVFSDWRPGSPIIFKGHIFFMIPIKMSGIIKRIEPERLLEYTLSNGKNTSIITHQLTFADRQTTLHFTDDEGTGENAEQRYMKAVNSWDKLLKRLKRVVENS